MKLGGIGGANTATGLIFEGKTDLATFLNSQKGYKITEIEKSWFDVKFDNVSVGTIFKQHGLYKYLTSEGIDYKTVLSKKLLPDDSIFVITENTVYIIEKKFQQNAGSVDEKLQTAGFKKKQYCKLFSLLNIEVEYMYLLSDWYRKDEYRDVRNYIQEVGCAFYFDYIPLKKLGLPIPKH
jgi:hypothetical protein